MKEKTMITNDISPDLCCGIYPNMIEKSDGNGNVFLVPDPDLFNDEGQRVKKRKKHTNITPKKKKRKK